MTFQNTKTRTLFTSILALLVIAGGALLTTVSAQSDQGHKQTTLAQQMENILRDESIPAEQRITQALALCDREKENTLQAAPATPPSFLQDPWGTSSISSDDWDPLREMERMRAQSRQLLATMNNQITLGQTPSSGFAGTDMQAWAPSGEFTENDQEYIYHFDIPGVGQSDVKVVTENHMLTVEGNRRNITRETTTEDENGNTRVLRSETSTGTFRRSMPLPPDADAENVTANLEEGVLKVTIPKTKAKDKAEPRMITIN